MRSALILIVSVVTLGCQNPVEKTVRNATYSAYELIGVEKRDLLKRRIENAKEEQKETQESFRDSLDKLRKLYGLNGGALEEQYERLRSSFDDSKAQVSKVHASIVKMDMVADDLFSEWEREIKEIESLEFRNKSKANLVATRSRFHTVSQSMATSESRMKPVLTKLNDHVLYLKHNLNAESVTNLKGEIGRVEGEIETLMSSMNKSISEAAEFNKTL